MYLFLPVGLKTLRAGVILTSPLCSQNPEQCLTQEREMVSDYLLNEKIPQSGITKPEEINIF